MRVRLQMCSEIPLFAFRLLKPYRIPQCPLRDLFGALEALGTLASTLVRVRCDADGERLEFLVEHDLSDDPFRPNISLLQELFVISNIALTIFQRKQTIFKNEFNDIL